MELLDHYLLKSLDAITDAAIFCINVTFDAERNEYQLHPNRDAAAYDDAPKNVKLFMPQPVKPWPFRGGYDEVIYGTDFLFECGIFSDEMCKKLLPNPEKKKYRLLVDGLYPVITNRLRICI